MHLAAFKSALDEYLRVRALLELLPAAFYPVGQVGILLCLSEMRAPGQGHMGVCRPTPLLFTFYHSIKKERNRSYVMSYVKKPKPQCFY